MENKIKTIDIDIDEFDKFRKIHENDDNKIKKYNITKSNS